MRWVGFTSTEGYLSRQGLSISSMTVAIPCLICPWIPGVSVRAWL